MGGVYSAKAAGSKKKEAIGPHLSLRSNRNQPLEVKGSESRQGGGLRNAPVVLLEGRRGALGRGPGPRGSHRRLPAERDTRAKTFRMRASRGVQRIPFASGVQAWRVLAETFGSLPPKIEDCSEKPGIPPPPAGGLRAPEGTKELDLGEHAHMLAGETERCPPPGPRS